MAKFGLIGNPISHSKSPLLFRAAYGECGDVYDLIEADTLEESLSLFLNGSYRGINVTSPYKDKVFQYISRPSRISAILGSANLMLKDRNFESNGIIHSYNTDYYGVKNTVSGFCNIADRVKSVAVIGAGGAGKAAALAMKESGYDVILVNRSREKAAKYADSIGAVYCPLDCVRDALESSQLIIYSLSFLLEQLDGYDFSEKVIFEANYADAQLSPAKGVSSKEYIDGRYWLYNQAIPAFEIFTCRTPDRDSMRRVIGIEKKYSDNIGQKSEESCNFSR